MQRDSLLRRRGQQLWKWGERLYIGVPLPVKNWFTRLARENGLSQSELGLALVQAAKADEAWACRAINLYRSTCDEQGCQSE
jgi:hypothetical protein